ncbi:hypothetical protein ACIO7M_14945 [Streptomyces toxytricini]|uniref:SWIM-type domain-containing protein n=1 Tax=Streptomyces toxytricini TaxID=67369 RepID=A0ABW8EGL6_STRT5
MSTDLLPPVAPEVLAEAVEHLTARLRKKLDAAVEGCATGATPAERGADGTVTIRFGEDAVVTLRPGPGGAVDTAERAACTCLLAPRCLHRAAALGAAPLADGPAAPEPEAEADPGRPAAAAPATGTEGPGGPAATTGSAAAAGGPENPSGGAEAPPPALTAAQTAAADALWRAGAEALAAGATAAGAVVQAELLRAAHSARVAGLPRAEAATLRLVRGLRSARERSGNHHLSDLAASFLELLQTAALLASGTADPAWTGTSRRTYRPGGHLRVYGLCREPVLTATGYGGVVTHLLSQDGGRHSLSDVRPGGLARAKGAGSASVVLGGAALDHAGLARGGLRIAGATVSPDGRLGAGRGVQAHPMPGIPWTEEPAAALFARPAAEAVAAQLADPDPDGAGPALLGCDVTVLGPAGEDLLVREDRPGGPVLRLRAAHPHPELPHLENLRRIASHPGLALRVLGRPDLDRAATLRPLAVSPVPGAAYTLRLPDGLLGRADLGYDRLQGDNFPPRSAAPQTPPAEPGPDPLAESPLWRADRLLESGVAGGRRAVAEAGRGPEPLAAYGPLRRAGFTTAAELAADLAAEADRRPRDAFGRLTDPSADAYAWAWLAAATHLAAARRALVAASWA